MAYQLMVKRNKYIPIDIRRHSKFIIDSNLKNSSTLKEIDLFTTQFESKEKLMDALLGEGLISTDDLDKTIMIRLLHKGKYHSIDSIFYSDEKGYLNEGSLESTLKILSTDDEFVMKLLDKYEPKDDERYNTRRPNINEETFYLIDSLKNSNVNKRKLISFLVLYRKIPFVEKTLNNIMALNYNEKEIMKALIIIFFKNLIHKRKYVRDNNYNEFYEDYLDYYVFFENIEYKALHNLAYFTYNYDLLRRQKEEYDKKVKHQYNEEIASMPQIINNTPKSNKKRVRTKKKNKQVEGQLSIWD